MRPLAYHLGSDDQTHILDIFVGSGIQQPPNLTVKRGFAQAQTLGQLVDAVVRVADIADNGLLHFHQKLLVEFRQIGRLRHLSQSQIAVSARSVALIQQRLDARNEIFERKRLLDIYVGTAIHTVDFGLQR